MIDLRISVNNKEIPENESPNKIIDIVKNIPDFNRQLKGRGYPSDLAALHRILTPKQINKWPKDYQLNMQN